MTVRDRGQGEAGSVIVALMVVVVVAMGLAAVFANVNSSLNLTRVDQDRTNAFQLADAGMDQALYRIDTKTTPLVASGTYEPILTGGVLTGFTEDLVVKGSNFRIEATKQGAAGQDATWKVMATGTDASGRGRRVIATVGAGSLFVDAFFTVDNFNLTGNQSTPRAYRSSVCVDPRGGGCWLPTPFPGRLGTNSIISGSAATAAVFRQTWGGFNMYGRTNQADADDACMSGGCGTAPKVAAITDRLVPDAEALIPRGKPCPNGGNLTGVLNGDYTCENINLSGTITVAAGGTVRLYPTKSFAVSSGAKVNVGQVPARFQVYFAEQTPAASGGICRSEIWALLYTPGLEIDCNGSQQPTIYGAVMSKAHDGRGAHFDFNWDADTANAVHTGKYVIKNWRECPVTQTDC